MSDLYLGFQVMAYGLIGVFSVIVLFYVMMALMCKAFPPEKEDM